MSEWQVRDRFLDLHTRWFSLIGEHLETAAGELLEYWRIERSHSVIVIPLWADHILLPAPIYRPGLGAATLDFPGGRLAPTDSIENAARQILQRELGIPDTAILDLTPLNQEGWPINSSFSNQKLYGLVARVDAEQPPPASYLSFPADAEGIRALADQLICLQCRSVLREWQLQS